MCKDMNKDLNRAKLITKISTPETLLALKIGAPSLIPTAKISTGAIRTAASRLEKSRKARFFVTTDGLINETKVIRLM